MLLADARSALSKTYAEYLACARREGKINTPTDTLTQDAQPVAGPVGPDRYADDHGHAVLLCWTRPPHPVY